MLVGGRSSRMGRDKALLPVGGTPLAARTAARVEAAAGRVTLVGDPERYAGLGYPVLADRFPGEGPLGAIVTALGDTAAEWNLVVACDMPGLTSDLLQQLLQYAEANQLKITVAQGIAGIPEPLCAVYHRSAAEPLARAFAGGTRKVTAAFEGIPVGVYPVAEMGLLGNLNTPQDWADYGAD